MIKIYRTVLNQNNLITTIPFKGVKVRVEFTGGNMMRGIPAKFYTNDRFTQRALDESDQYGRLFTLEKAVAEEGDVEPAGKAAGTVVQPASATATKSQGTVVVETPLGSGSATPAGGQGNGDSADGGAAAELQPAENGTEQPDETGGNEQGAGERESADNLEFDNLGEAITYIAAHYGIQVETAYQARNVIREQAGVKAVIHNG